MSWYFQALRRYAVFGERAQRMEYWVFDFLYTLFANLIFFNR